MDGADKARLVALEKVVDKLLQRPMSDKSSKANEKKEPPVDPVVSHSGSVQLVYKKYFVDFNGKTHEVDAEYLESNPELLAHMLKNHPTCFKS